MNVLNGPIFVRICYQGRKRNGISLTVSAQISPYVDLTLVIWLRGLCMNVIT